MEQETLDFTLLKPKPSNLEELSTKVCRWMGSWALRANIKKREKKILKQQIERSNITNKSINILNEFGIDIATRRWMLTTSPLKDGKAQSQGQPTHSSLSLFHNSHTGLSFSQDFDGRHTYPSCFLVEAYTFHYPVVPNSK